MCTHGYIYIHIHICVYIHTNLHLELHLGLVYFWRCFVSWIATLNNYIPIIDMQDFLRNRSLANIPLTTVEKPRLIWNLKWRENWNHKRIRTAKLIIMPYIACTWYKLFENQNLCSVPVNHTKEQDYTTVLTYINP